MYVCTILLTCMYARVPVPIYKLDFIEDMLTTKNKLINRYNYVY